MPRFAALLLVTILAGAVWLLSTTVGAQTPTPTGSPSPTASSAPIPTPYGGPTSTITIRFIRDGQPVIIRGNRLKILADGASCNFAEPGAPVDYGPVLTQLWPLDPNFPPQPPECTKGPPTRLRFEFSSQFGLLATEFVWSGNDVNVDIVVPAASPSPTTTPPSALLPSTGGVASNDSRLATTWLIVGIAVYTALSSIFILAAKQRR